MFRFLIGVFVALCLCETNAVADNLVRLEDVAYVAETLDEAEPIDADGLITIDELIKRPADATKCSTKIFADALANSASEVDADAAFESDIEMWVAQVFAQKDVLEGVLQCDEIKDSHDMANIKFMPITYTFPNGRHIVVNYETQPELLRQRLRLLKRPDLMTAETDDPTDGKAIWTNVDPSWYGIMVVEAGTLDQFVGKDKPNTVSLSYITENIDRLYPKDHGSGTCTSKTAWADDDDAVNVAMVQTVGRGGDDPNDYYVAGDRNLGWVMYAEIAADIVLTIVTMGSGAAITYSAKMARLARVEKLLAAEARVAAQAGKVKSFLSVGRELEAADRSLDLLKAQRAAAADDLVKATKNLETLTDAQRKNLTDIQTNITRYENQLTDLRSRNAGSREISRVQQRLGSAKQQLNRTRKDYGVNVEGAQRNLDDLDDVIRRTEGRKATLMARQAKLAKHADVKRYNKVVASLEDLNKYRRQLKGLNPKRGNVLSRMWQRGKALRAINNGNKILRRAERLGRASTFAGRARDFLFISTRQFVGMLGKGVQHTGALYAAVNFLGDMYDQTDTSTGEYTNGADFKPWLLLSADDIEGQENVINYGMWLMWIGDSVVPADDDAAYLQAFDFASKFHQDLLEVQGNQDAPCNVDIYVVRPILRSPGTGSVKLYYLIMNDVPWSTSSAEVPD